jgi:hypothetical protein
MATASTRSPGLSTPSPPARTRPSRPSRTRRRRFYGVQFHPEVVNTPRGALMLRNFTHNIAGLKGDWTMAAFKEEAIAKIREQVGSGKVICGLSGGVDSRSPPC